MIATFLACACAGMTYVPLDVSIPQERKNNIIKQLNTNMIIDSNIELMMDKPIDKEIPKIFLNENHVYYIIFTSGSTGAPKGVQITYQNLKSCMNWLLGICDVDKGIILNQANYSFDLSVADIYLSLLTRSKHYILERNTQKDFPKLFQELKKSQATFAVMTPSFAELLMIDKSFDANLMPALKKILFCGEKLTEKTVVKLYERFKEIEIINSYGPTECTFAVTSCIVKNEEQISIGIPKDDVDIFIMNDKFEILEDGKIGEILIVGESVGLGYLNKAMNNAFIDFQGKKAYCTGDLGYKENGKLYYMGRKDKQIKYKGYRIELSEIENVLYELEWIEKAVVIARKNREEQINKIIAFVKVNSNSNVTIQEIKKYLVDRLPEYMIPFIKIVNEMPLNENGKINEKELLEGV